MQVTLIFEHKSEKPDTPIKAQLIRYISNIWHNNTRQGNALSLTVPVLIYHGTTPIIKETPRILFPDAPEELLEFIPAFNYILLDINALPDETIENLSYLLLRNILLALKHSRDESYIDVNWKKIIIFAPGSMSQSINLEIFQATAIYMSRTSDKFNEKMKDMDTALASSEELVVKPYLIQLYEDGMEKGLEKGMEKLLIAFLKKHPGWTDQQIADSFDVSATWVKQVRATL
jgi:predicted transposase/invertase (TIGR01784 family)